MLVQPVGTKATEAARRGETGTLIATNYLGRRALHAYAPLNLKGLNWVIVASIDSDEAFAPSLPSAAVWFAPPSSSSLWPVWRRWCQASSSSVRSSDWRTAPKDRYRRLRRDVAGGLRR